MFLVLIGSKALFWGVGPFKNRGHLGSSFKISNFVVIYTRPKKNTSPAKSLT